MNDIDEMFIINLSLILIKIKRNNYYFPQNQDRARFEVIMEKYREKLSFKYQVIAKKFELNKNRWEVESNISKSQPLPDAINTERAKKYFPRAVEAGYMELTETGYKWLFGGAAGGKARLAYFLHKVYNPDGCSQIPYKRLNALFGVVRLDVAIDQMLYAKRAQKWRPQIDILFND